MRRDVTSELLSLLARDDTTVSGAKWVLNTPLSGVSSWQGAPATPIRVLGQIAYRVGYGSPSQFSRAYRRQFGVSPSEDAAQRHSTVGSTPTPCRESPPYRDQGSSQNARRTISRDRSPEAEGDLRQLQPPFADAAVLHRSAEPTIVNLMVQYPTTVDRAFAALADPTRRAVLERLGSGRATISELAEPFGMSLTGMKKHVRLLEEAELVTTEKVGRVRRCMLAPYAFEGISMWLQRLDRFAQVVERTKGDR
jgi:DNA-binding transcriptional ArsR family regulator/AraC-like DNA-binding protein